ncbi:MAG: STAS domain-containing protein [Planctomycetaceae bacterium]|mgnify:CR=1 FL=1|nr:STAS domain-containing protein [Planctomycetaceae bacterium]
MIDYRRREIGVDGQVLLMELSGQLDAAACEFLFSVIDGEIEDGRNQLIMDCHDLRFISSIGLGMLIRIHSKAKKNGGDVKLSRVHGVIADVIKLVMLDKVLQIYPTVDEAVAAFEA